MFQLQSLFLCHVFKFKKIRNETLFQKTFPENFISKWYTLHWKTFQISVWTPIIHIGISVKYTTSIWFVQIWVVLDSDTIQICEVCQYDSTPLNSTEDKSDYTFEEEIVDYDYSDTLWRISFIQLLLKYSLLWIMISVKFWI